MSTILLLHIVSFCASLVLTGSLLTLSATGRRVASAALAFSMVPAVSGAVSGIALLFSHPLGSDCAILAAYLIAFTWSTVVIRRRNARLTQTVVS